MNSQLPYLSSWIHCREILSERKSVQMIAFLEKTFFHKLILFLTNDLSKILYGLFLLLENQYKVI